MRYVILAKGGHTDFIRQLVQIGNERILDRTIRLLKENGVKDIVVTGEYKDLGDVIVYNPINNTYNYDNDEGYWLDAFSYEFLVEPVCFIWGDVYFSEEAIKIIVETKTNSHLFFCTYKNERKEYIKNHDEPLAYKVVDTEIFKKHIELVKKMYDKGLTVRHPIVWELYRSLNGINVNWHTMTKNYVAINDISCDIDNMKDVYKLKNKLGECEMIRLEIIEEVEAGRFNEIKDLIRKNPLNAKEGTLYKGDIFLANKDLADYFLGDNRMNKEFAKVIEVIPEKTSTKKEIPEENKENEEVFDEKAQKKNKKIKK